MQLVKHLIIFYEMDGKLKEQYQTSPRIAKT